MYLSEIYALFHVECINDNQSNRQCMVCTVCRSVGQSLWLVLFQVNESLMVD